MARNRCVGVCVSTASRFELQCMCVPVSGWGQVYKVKTDHHFFPIQRFVHNNRFEWERTIVSTPYTSPHTGVQQMRRQSSLLRYEGGGGDSPARKPPRSATPRFYTSPRVRVLGVAAIVALVAVVWKRSNR